MSTHDEEATARDTEVSRLHPGVERRHVKATLPGKIVLRDVEKNENEPKIGLVAPAYLTAVVTHGQIEFYAGSNPVQSAGTIPTSRVVAVESGNEVGYTRLDPVVRLKLSEPGTEPLDLELEVFAFDGSTLKQVGDAEAEAAWWKAALAR